MLFQSDIPDPGPLPNDLVDRLAMRRRLQSIPSLPEVSGSVAVPSAGGFLRRLLAFFGPGYLIAVGYMDPGNWATSLAGGSSFGYTLLFVALLSSIIAIFLQALCVRLGIATGRDLAQLCREWLPEELVYPLWLLAELAICATDLAELIGTAIALELLFGIPLLYGMLLTAFDALLILLLQHKGMRWLEALIIGAVVLIVGCFAVQLVMADPTWGAVLGGYVPTWSVLTDNQQFYIAMGIIGATVMPHNLYLHTALVQSRQVGPTLPEKQEAVRLATIDSTAALVVALLINSAILITAAAAFNANGLVDIAELQEAYRAIGSVLENNLAPTLFAVALLICGLSATVTATLSGQVVLEGFLRLPLRPVVRRLVTRVVTIVPAMIVTWLYGAGGATNLLIFSQVVLSMQLPFAVVPLMLFSSDRKLMGELSAPRWQLIAGWAVAALIILLNIHLLVRFAPEG